MPWILIAIGGLLLLGLLVVAFVLKNTKRPPDYYAFFIIGLIWLAVGLPFKNYALWTMGLVFVAIGLSHKKDWEKNRIKWGKLSKNEKSIRIVSIIVLSILVLLGLVAWLAMEYKNK